MKPYNTLIWVSFVLLTVNGCSLVAKRSSPRTTKNVKSEEVVGEPSYRVEASFERTGRYKSWKPPLSFAARLVRQQRVRRTVEEKTVWDWQRMGIQNERELVLLCWLEPVVDLCSFLYHLAKPKEERRVVGGFVGGLYAVAMPLVTIADENSRGSAGKSWEKTVVKELEPEEHTVEAVVAARVIIDGEVVGRVRDKHVWIHGLRSKILSHFLAGDENLSVSIELVAVENPEARETTILNLRPSELLGFADDAAKLWRADYFDRCGLEGFDALPLFWACVREAAIRQRSGVLAEAASKRLRGQEPRGDFAGLDSADWKALAGRNAVSPVTLSDGAEVDWRAGKPLGPPRGEVTLRLLSSITAGESARVEVSVRNSGKGAMHRLYAVTRSDEGFAEGIPVLFGRIAPGQVLTRVFEIPTPATVTGSFDLALDFRESHNHAPAAGIVRVDVESAPQPMLGLGLLMVDDGSGQSAGNGDNIVQKGEAIEMRFSVRNSGRSTAIGTVLKLRLPRVPGLETFGATRFELGDIPPDGFEERTVSIAIQQMFTAPDFEIVALLTEESDFRKKLEQPFQVAVGEPTSRSVVALNRRVVVTEETSFLRGADRDSASFGEVNKGGELRATGQLGEFVRVEFPREDGSNEIAWLPSEVVSFDIPKGELVASPGRTTVIREFRKSPPVIVLATPTPEGETQVYDDRCRVSATIQDPDGLTEVTLLVNGTVVSDEGSRGIAGVERGGVDGSAKDGSRTRWDLDTEAALSLGSNEIVIEATDGSGAHSRVSATVRRVQREGSVYALIVGINTYEDRGIDDLRFAERDAEEMAKFFCSDRSPIPAENVKLLLGSRGEATSQNVEIALESHLLEQAIRPEDMVLFFFAGHGFSSGEQYYLACSDSKKTRLRSTSLGVRDLQDYWGEIAAERKVFLADACHSGGLLGLRGENAINNGLMTEISGKGKVVIAAARENQISVELEEYRHGAFTYALLQGLGGRADQEAGDRDGRVSVEELKAFLGREVPILARSQGKQQVPVSSSSSEEGTIFLTRRAP